MRRIHILILSILFMVLNAQSSPSVQGAVGAVTIDGKIWNQIALRPVVPIGKVAVALDIVLYIDQDGNIHKDEWDFSNGTATKNTLIDKIYYIRYGQKWEPLYLKVGALDGVSMGYGILANGYSNSIQYPQVRKVGMEMGVKRNGFSFYGFTNDFKENLGVAGFRVVTPPFMGIPTAFSIISDRNQYLGLKDSDEDGRPDLVDDFPNDITYWLDTDGDNIADRDPAEWDIDGDGITDTLDSNIPGWTLDTTIVLDDSISRKPEPLNIFVDEKPVSAVALDFGYPLVKEKHLSVSVYAQIAKMIGETVSPENEEKVDLGTGIVPLGVSAKFGPATFNLEYHIMPEGRFEFGYWNRSYEIDRATFSSNSEGQGVSSMNIVTKSSKLGYYGKQKGPFSRLNLNLGSYLGTGISYQNLFGKQWNFETQQFEENTNQSFLAFLRLRKSISKIKTAEWYYQQRNVPNPFDFELTENTILGYRLGLELGNGMILVYNFRRSFRDLDGDGKVDGPDEVVNITTIETSFSF